MNRKIVCVFASVLVLAPVAISAEGDAELAKSLEKSSALERYTFQIENKGGNGNAIVEGTYQKGQPVFLQAERIPFYKAGDVLVYKQGDTWKRSKRGIESDPLLILGASAKVTAARLPHEELGALAKGVKEPKKGDKKEKDCWVFSGDLTPEGARKLAPTEFQDVARSGNARVWVNEDGAVVRYALSIRVQGKRGNAEVDGTVEKTVKLGDIGTAKVEVPEGAKKALE
jgi:hypothetical protein